jgi:hypothetical protein
MALIVKFIQRSVTETPILVEPAPVDDVDKAVELARQRLEELRYHLTPPPSGFVIEDDTGRELRRWIEQ